MRIEQSFSVRRPPAEVFAFMTDPANLASWQPSKVAIEPLTDGPPRKGYRVRERTRIGLRQWDQVDLTGLMRLLEPLIKRGIARSFRQYHGLLARNVETAAPTAGDQA
jgi:polyketide cyclase/dehydrase/lipid transport protein